MTIILSIIRSTLRQLLMLAALLLVLLAVYVSLGQQLLPLVSRYQAEIETELSMQLGMPVRVEQVTGSWNRLNPGVRLTGVSLGLPGDEGVEVPLLVSELDVELDALRSLREWRLMLSRVTIREADLQLQQSADGSWQLAGLGSAAGVGLSADQALELASRFRDLSLTGVDLELLSAEGHTLLLEQASVNLQTQNARLVMDLGAKLPGQDELLVLSADLSGRQAQQLSGDVYFRLPDGDFSALASLIRVRQWQGERLAGAVEAWLSLDQGQLLRGHGSLAIPELSLVDDAGSQLEFSQLQGLMDIRRTQGDQGWDVVLQNAGFNWDGRQWPATDLSLQARGETGLVLQVQRLDVGMLRSLTGEMQLLPAEVLLVLDEFSPRGRLESVVLAMEGRGTVTAARLEAELQEVALDARRGSPALWGLNGYVELAYSEADRLISGQVEVDSDTLMMHLPRLFTAPWSYSRVNGRVKLRADLSDGVDLRLASGVIQAESDIIDGRARFAVDFRRTAEGEVSSGLELMVGTLAADISRKSAYLPMAPDAPPSIQGAMQWVDNAVLSGEGGFSGLIYRGSTVPGAGPEEKTLQMFYRVRSGELRFHPEWPILEQMDGLVLIDDRRINVEVERGVSAGIGFDSTQASITPNPEGPGSWLSVSGSGRGAAADGLRYLQQTPVTRGFGSYLSGWQAEGDVELALELRLPLYMEQSRPQVSLQLSLQDNALRIPELDLDFADINGALHYRESSGLVSQAMTAELFGEQVGISLYSDGTDAEQPGTRIEVQGGAGLDRFLEWDGHTALGLALLAHAEGHMQYRANYSLPHQRPDAADGVASTFSLESTLEGVSIDLPAPLAKQAAPVLPMRLDIDFLNAGNRRVRGNLGEIFSYDVQLDDGNVPERGLVYLGTRNEGLPVRRFNSSAPGLEILGTLDTFNYDEWARVSRTIMAASGGSIVPGREFPLVADIMLSDARFMGQTVSDLNLQVSSTQESWVLELDSDEVAGTVRLPVDSDDYIRAELAHLRLPGSEQEKEQEQTGQEPDETDAGIIAEPAPDPLAEVDPREFPPLQFSTEEFMIGQADYGQWRFTLDPLATGVRLTDLAIVSRGLELGAGDNEAEYVWTFDGSQHSSRLKGQVTAGNLAQVLSAFGYAPSLESSNAVFNADLSWPASPAAFSAVTLKGAMDLQIQEGRFLQGGSGAGNSALKLISILNFDALMRRLRFSDDLVRSGLAYEEIRGVLLLQEGQVQIVDRLHIIGPSSLFQVMGKVDLREETIDGSMYITLPVSDNIPWLGGLAALNNLINWQVAVGVFLFDRIFGDQVDELTSAQYLLQGPWEGLEPQLNQVFTAGDDAGDQEPASPATGPEQPPVEVTPVN